MHYRVKSLAVSSASTQLNVPNQSMPNELTLTHQFDYEPNGSVTAGTGTLKVLTPGSTMLKPLTINGVPVTFPLTTPYQIIFDMFLDAVIVEQSGLVGGSMNLYLAGG